MEAGLAEVQRVQEVVGGPRARGSSRGMFRYTKHMQVHQAHAGLFSVERFFFLSDFQESCFVCELGRAPMDAGSAEVGRDQEVDGPRAQDSS